MKILLMLLEFLKESVRIKLLLEIPVVVVAFFIGIISGMITLTIAGYVAHKRGWNKGRWFWRWGVALFCAGSLGIVVIREGFQENKIDWMSAGLWTLMGILCWHMGVMMAQRNFTVTTVLKWIRLR